MADEKHGILDYRRGKFKRMNKLLNVVQWEWELEGKALNEMKYPTGECRNIRLKTRGNIRD